MDFLERFLASQSANPPSFQLLLTDLSELNAEALRTALREFHPDLVSADVEFVPANADPRVVDRGGPPPALLGIASWGEHTVRIVACDAPMTTGAVESCLRPALLPPDFKERARRHRAHVLVDYAGRCADPLEQLVALGCVAGIFAYFGSLAILNEEARAAIAPFALTADDEGEDMLATLRSLPVPYLYGGFVKMELTDIPGVWIRTFACHRLGLPNLAMHRPTHADGERIFHLFSGVLGYLRDTGSIFEPGELIRIDDTTVLAVRTPEQREWWLDSDGPIWILDEVRSEV